MATLLDTEHRCCRCQNWSGGWERCRHATEITRARASSYLTNYVQKKQTRENLLDEVALEDVNVRFGAIIDWWVGHRIGPYNEDHVAAVTLDFVDIPLEEVIAILDRTLARARTKPYSLRYFKVALEEGRGAFFKSQGSAVRRSTDVVSTGDLLPALLERLRATETPSEESGGARPSRPTRAPGGASQRG